MISFMVDTNVCQVYMTYSLLGGILLGIFIVILAYVFSKL